MLVTFKIQLGWKFIYCHKMCIPLGNFMCHNLLWCFICCMTRIATRGLILASIPLNGLLIFAYSFSQINNFTVVQRNYFTIFFRTSRQSHIIIKGHGWRAPEKLILVISPSYFVESMSPTGVITTPMSSMALRHYKWFIECILWFRSNINGSEALILRHDTIKKFYTIKVGVAC